MADFGLTTFEVGGWYHFVHTAETNSAVVVARDETAAARSPGPAKLVCVLYHFDFFFLVDVAGPCFIL